jgi:hypothetical protein
MLNPSRFSEPFRGNFSKNFITKGLYVICQDNKHLIGAEVLPAQHRVVLSISEEYQTQ